MTFKNNEIEPIFRERLDVVYKYFHSLSDCERIVTLFALLKGVHITYLKFIQTVIEDKFAKCNNLEQIMSMEAQSNDNYVLTKLCDQYINGTSATIGGSNATITTTTTATTTATTTTTVTATTKPTQDNKNSLLFLNEFDQTKENTNHHTNVHQLHRNNNNISNNNNNIANNYNILHDKNIKESILKQIWNCVLFLQNGNHEVKDTYIQFIPYMVEDVKRGIVNQELVLEILTLLLIHPAITLEDRETLNDYIKRLEAIINQPQTDQLCTSWQTIAPPANMQSTSSLSSVASSQRVLPGSTENLLDSDCGSSSDFIKVISAPFCKGGLMNTGVRFDTSADERQFASSLNTVVRFDTNTEERQFAPSLNTAVLFDTSSDDHHVSFSKNGTECTDFDIDSDRSNTQIDFRAMPALNFLTVPNELDQAVLKTRRSNSLTTGTNLHHQPYAFTASTENLSNIARQQRSFSLTDSRRSSLTSSGSEARLGESYMPMHVGMGNIGIWLKGERLHKYQKLFNGMTYEELMGTTNDYLIEWAVTEGARNKLVRCIQALWQRHDKLTQMEEGLINGTVDLSSTVEELKAMVITPMKPLDEVPQQFLKVLNLVVSMVTQKHITPDDKNMVESLLRVLELAMRSEAFIKDVGPLRDQQIEVNNLKFKYPALSCCKSGSMSGLNNSKPSYRNNSKTMKATKNLYGSNFVTDMKMHRKNSNPLPGKHQSKITRTKNNLYGTSTNKSSSYPNCSSNSNMMRLPHNYHHHSVSNLITIKIKPNQSMVIPSNSLNQNQQHLASSSLLSINKPSSNCASLFDSGLMTSSFDTMPQSISQRSSSIGSTTFDNVPSHCVRSSSSGANRIRSRPLGDADLGLEVLCMQVAQSGMN